MAHRRGIQLLSRHATALISLKSTPRLAAVRMLSSSPQLSNLVPDLDPSRRIYRIQSRYLSSSKDDGSEDEDEDEDDEEDEEDEESEIDDFSEGEGVDAPEPARVYSPKEKEAEAADIGYKVVGPLQRSDRVFKPYEPVFAVVQIGSHQFKVSNGDCIFAERLKFCEVNDKLILNKVLMLGSPTQTIIGRPTLPEAAVHAVVEEHALDAKVIIFKKKKRKNYRRCNGHRQELTKLRITDIQGIEKPEVKPEIKPLKLATEKPQKKPMVAA